MRIVCFAALALIIGNTAQAAEWRAQRVETPARVEAVETVGDAVEINAGGLWYRLSLGKAGPALTFLDDGPKFEHPEGALPDSRVAVGTGDISRAWLTEPTDRYDHGILGDKLGAGALAIQRRDGTRQTVKLGADAVFEDLEPRIADLDGDGRDEIVLVKSSLRLGSSLAVIGWRKNRYDIVAETPALGAPHRWLNPAGIADFLGTGKKQIALVRQPHVVGALELWAYDGGRLNKVAELPDAANHIAGTRAIRMSVVVDVDGDDVGNVGNVGNVDDVDNVDNVDDLAVPSLDRTRLRLIGFKPQMHEIASVALAAKPVTDLAALTNADGPAIVLGLADGSLALVRRTP